MLSQVRSADEISVFLDSKVHETGIAGLDITNWPGCVDLDVLYEHTGTVRFVMICVEVERE